MWKAMGGIVAGLALVTSMTWADEKTGDARSAAESSQVTLVDTRGAKALVDAGRGSEMASVPEDQRASHEERASRAAREAHEDFWLQTREGYRDGGY